MSDWLMVLADPLYLIVDIVLDKPLTAVVLTSLVAVAATFVVRG